MKFYKNIFNEIISLENFFLAWDEFKKDKLKKKDVLEFEWNLEPNIFKLYRDLKYHRYNHGVYASFNICDPKQRKISKATVRDRVLHHAIFRVLNPFFEPSFIAHSFSCRVKKGTHKGVNSLAYFLNKVSKNTHKPCFALKCDIKKFFNSVDHEILLSIIAKRIKDDDTIWLLKEIIGSFSTKDPIERETTGDRAHLPVRLGSARQGIPIGNLTSQLFANIYLNELDYFVKHSLKVKYYARYTDDFVIISDQRNYLEDIILPTKSFLRSKLKLELHPHKISIRKLKQGIDFLGYVLLPKYRILRTKTKRRMFKRANQNNLASYLGLLKWCDSYYLRQALVRRIKIE